MQELTSTALRVPDPGIRALFARDAQRQTWLDVEAELAAAEAELGIVPAEAAAEIRRKAHLELMDLARVEESFRVTGHRLVCLIWEFDRICEGDAGRYIHWGATTQNIIQTAHLIQVRRAKAIFERQLGRILTAMADLAERSKDYAIAGRTHGQHAVPATFGLKVAAWIDELCRHVDRLHDCEPRLFMAMLGGAAGTFASFGDKGIELQAVFAKRLDMRPMPVPHRTTADHTAEFVCILALIGSTSAKIAQEIYRSMQDEYGEAREPVSPGTVGSSTMPQKRNPILSEAIISFEPNLSAQVQIALRSMQGEHEASNAFENMMTRSLGDACVLLGDILERLAMLMEGLELFPERMRRNLDLSGGLIMSEAVMLELGEHVGRQRAHDAVYEAVEDAARTGEPFTEALRRRPEIASELDDAAIDRLLDPVQYVGLCATLAVQQAQRAREVAKGLGA